MRRARKRTAESRAITWESDNGRRRQRHWTLSAAVLAAHVGGEVRHLQTGRVYEVVRGLNGRPARGRVFPR